MPCEARERSTGGNVKRGVVIRRRCLIIGGSWREQGASPTSFRPSRWECAHISDAGKVGIYGGVGISGKAVVENGAPDRLVVILLIL